MDINLDNCRKWLAMRDWMQKQTEGCLIVCMLACVQYRFKSITAEIQIGAPDDF